MQRHEITLDPTNRFQDAEGWRIREAVGILLDWIDRTDPRPAREQYEEKYAFGVHPSLGGKIDPDGTFHFPEDPPQFPLIKLERDHETVYFYLHSFVSIVNRETGEHFRTRMD